MLAVGWAVIFHVCSSCAAETAAPKGSLSPPLTFLPCFFTEESTLSSRVCFTPAHTLLSPCGLFCFVLFYYFRVSREGESSTCSFPSLNSCQPRSIFFTVGGVCVSVLWENLEQQRRKGEWGRRRCRTQSFFDGIWNMAYISQELIMLKQWQWIWQYVANGFKWSELVMIHTW